MRRVAVLAALVAFLGGVSYSPGADAKDSYEKVMDEMLKVMNDYVTIMDGVTSEATAQAAKPKLEALSKKGQALKKRADALGKPTQEEQQKLAKKYFPEFVKLGPKLKEATEKQQKYDALKGIKVSQ